MKLPRVRFTVSRLMVAVAVSAPIAAIGVRVYAASRTTGHPVAILTAVFVTGLVALVALRKPLVALALVMLTYLMTPFLATVPRTNYYYHLLSQLATLAWVIYAPLGWGLKLIRNYVRKLPLAADLSESK
jgi:hypothetical protein